MNRHRSVLRALVLGFAGVLALGSSAAAAPDPDEPDLPPGDISIIGTDVTSHPRVELEVSIPVTLTGGPVSPEDLEVRENGVPMNIDITPVPTDRLEVVLLIDLSGSMLQGGAITAAIAAAVEFLDELPADVPVGIVSFADAPSLVSPLTTDRVQLVDALQGLRASGRTALYDAVVFARALFSGGTTDRQLVVLSDGGDNNSATTIDDALAITQEIRTSIVELVTDESEPEILRQLAEAGGGALSSATDPSGLSQLYRDIAVLLANRYRLGFVTERTGSTPYTVTLRTAEREYAASSIAALPSIATTTTTMPATTTTTTTPEDVATTVTTTPEERPDDAVGSADAVGPADGSPALLIGGATAVFLSISSLVLLVSPAEAGRGAGRRQLGLSRTRQRQERAPEPSRLSTFADDALERQGRRRGLSDVLDVAAVPLRPGEFVIVVASAAVTVAAVLLLLGGPLLSIVGLIAIPLVARAVVSMRAERRRRAFADQLPDVLQLLTSGLRAGFALPQALDAVATQAAEPARSEFQRVLFEARVGRDLDEALQATATRMQSRPFEWVVAAFDINRQVGGELATVVENISGTIRERQELARQVKTLTAEARMSAYVVTGLPIFVFLALSVLSPGYFDPLREPPGPVILMIAAVLMVIGWFWMRRLTKGQD